MNATSITFFQKWNTMIAPETEAYHHKEALYNNMITIAIVVSFIAVAVISTLIFPEIASLLILGTIFLLAPAIELSQFFLSKAREAKKLEEQAQKVRTCYQKLISKKTTFPEIKALSYHWKQKALESQKRAQDLYQKALEKEKNRSISSSLIKKYRIEALEAEKTAKSLKIYSLFLESLIGRQKIFEKVFVKHGENLSSAFSDFSIWDSRDSETRAMDPKFTKNDFLLRFYNPAHFPISYKEVYQKEEELKNRLYQAILSPKMT